MRVVIYIYINIQYLTNTNISNYIYIYNFYKQPHKWRRFEHIFHKRHKHTNIYFTSPATGEGHDQSGMKYQDVPTQ